MGIVRYVFLNEHQATAALEQLRREFADHQIRMKRIAPSSLHAETDADDHDPIGGWRLAGTPLMTLPATGATLAGNSTTIDMPLGGLDELLRAVAEDEAAARTRRAKTRILADVTVDSPEQAEQAGNIMARSGGYALATES